MPEYPELEIRLFRRDTNSYAVELRFRDPDDPVERAAQDYPLSFDFAGLAQASLDAHKHGTMLGRTLLDRPAVRGMWDVARQQAGARPLRVRLTIDPHAMKLQRLRWETLVDPATQRTLTRNETLYFSRYLGSYDMRRVELGSRAAAKALVVVANPEGVQDQPYGRPLRPIVVEKEFERIKESLGGVAIATLQPPERATLDTIRKRLRTGEFDIFCLVCHGALVNEEPRLWLEQEDGKAKVTSGTELEDALAGLPRLPRLVLLASCQSGGDGQIVHSEDEGALAALGPRLAAVGVPAVIAMQGNVYLPTLTGFLKAFFASLREDGQIDKAMTIARWQLREEPDFWAPVLFTRLVDGRLWSAPQVAGDFDMWPGLLKDIATGRTVPILGSGLLDSLVGSPAEIARRWALEYGYPLAPPTGGALPQVAQFLRVKYGKGKPPLQFVDELAAEICKRWPKLEAAFPADADDSHERLLRLLSAAWRGLREHQPQEPDAHEVLARLPFRRYVTTNPDSLLVEALKDAGKKPSEIRCCWRQDAASGIDIGPGRPPPGPGTKDAPLIYQLFGHLSDPQTLLLTEDDYFDFLLGVSRRQDDREQLAPMHRALTSNGLLFLGFRLDDLDFRTFCRFLLAGEGRHGRRDLTSIGVQLHPDQGRGLPTASVRKYLESYFGDEQRKITIYWASVEDFVKELNQRWQAYQPASR